ncbi:MAG: hypothetical protein PHR44_08105 [Candidatus Omnitrophica bacterium]|nr:hypothetical protein [Candidatus Omnitrophota bacterium]
MIKIRDGQQGIRLKVRGKGTGQVTIESTVAFIAFVVLLLGTFNILLWFSNNFKYRHTDYQSGRIFNMTTVENEKRDDEELGRGTRRQRLYPWSTGFYTAKPLYVFDRENPALHRD